MDEKIWFSNVECEHSAVTTAIEVVSEKQIGKQNIIERTYSIEIGWRDLPEENEIRTPIWANTNYGLQRRVFVGRLTARLRSQPFWPTSAVLSMSNLSEKIVFENNKEDSIIVWRVDETNLLPPWLKTEWKNENSRQILIFRLDSTKLPMDKDSVIHRITIINEQNERNTITALANK